MLKVNGKRGGKGADCPVGLEEIEAFLRSRRLPFRSEARPDVKIWGFSSVNQYRKGTVTWIKSQEKAGLLSPETALCIVQEGVDAPVPDKIISPVSKQVFFSLIEYFFEQEEETAQISPTAVILTENIGEGVGVGPYSLIGKNVVIGNRVVIGSGCVIDGDISIGNGTVLSDHVVLKNRVIVGKSCRIQALTVIGEDGFGYTEDGNCHKEMIKHHGGVRIGDDVFIGSHVNIARGTIDDTVIGSGVKLAPSTHIGHNNRIEDDAVVICSQLYGSVHVGQNAYVVGSIVKNQCSVGENTMIGMGSVVTKDFDAGKVAVGAPARVLRDR